MRELVGWEGRNEGVLGRDICFTAITLGTSLHAQSWPGCIVRPHAI